MPRLRIGETVTLWGVERDKLSPHRGEVVCPVINLWNTTRCSKVVARLSHGAEVEILNSDRDDRRYYYRVSGRDETGKIMMGWVSEPFIKECEK